MYTVILHDIEDVLWYEEYRAATILLHNDTYQARESRTTSKILWHGHRTETMLHEWNAYENLALHWRSCRTITVQQPCCSTMKYIRESCTTSLFSTLSQQNRFYYTITVQQPCCTMNVPDIREYCTTVHRRSCHMITVQQPCCCTMECTREYSITS